MDILILEKDDLKVDRYTIKCLGRKCHSFPQMPLGKEKRKWPFILKV
jgi:hypothetical protein